LSLVNGPTLLSGPPATVFGVLAAPVMADPELDPKGRMWLSYKGTAAGDSATGTVTIRCDETGDQFVVSLTPTRSGGPTAAVMMVLDQSNSMTFDSGLGNGIQRQDVLKFSAPTAVVVLEDEHAMGVCTFDTTPSPSSCDAGRRRREVHHQRRDRGVRSQPERLDLNRRGGGLARDVSRR